MAADDLAAFRDAHPSAREAIMKCERPDWAIQIAFGATTNRMGAIREGINTARYIIGSRSARDLLIPWPTPYEAIDRWSDNDDAVSTSLANARALIIATIISVPLAYVLNQQVTGFSFGGLNAMFFAIAFALAGLIRLSIALVVRLQVSRLDEERAMKRILELIAEGTRKRPKRAERVMKFLHLNLPELVDDAAQRTTDLGSNR